MLLLSAVVDRCSRRQSLAIALSGLVNCFFRGRKILLTKFVLNESLPCVHRARNAAPLPLSPAKARSEAPNRIPMTPTPADSLDLAAVTAGLAPLLASAGEIALGFARTGAKQWRKDDKSVVTEADLAVDAFLQDALGRLLPEAGWLSEEIADTPERLARRRVWVVDPIDGTRAFVEGIPTWCISVALVEDGRPLLGAVYNPSTGECFRARRGGGAELGGRPIRARANGAAINGAHVVGPRPVMEALAATGLRRGDSIYALAYRLVSVADGRIDAAISSGRAKDWDIAAADVILAEAGARLVQMDGATPVYNRPVPAHQPLVAATEPLNAALRAALRQAAALPSQTWL
jgi:myo-inositol-1(or 4)-monophosphatase